MKITPRILQARRPGAFTLIELLTVIVIIGILAGILFAAGPAIMRTAKKASTRSDMKALEIAINDFYTEYGRYPVPSTSKMDLFIGGDGGTSTVDLMNVLLAEDAGWNQGHKLNPKRRVFFKPRVAKGTNDAPRGGLGEDGKYYDMWGSEYRILIDANYDEIIEGAQVSEFDYLDRSATGSDGKFSYLGGVLIQSFGEDKEHGKKSNQRYRGSDDAASWL